MANTWSSCKAIGALHIEPDQDPLIDNGNPDPENKKPIDGVSHLQQYPHQEVDMAKEVALLWMR